MRLRLPLVLALAALLSLASTTSAQVKYSRQNELITMAAVTYARSSPYENIGFYFAHTRDGRFGINLALSFSTTHSPSKSWGFLAEVALLKPTAKPGLGATLAGGLQDSWISPSPVTKLTTPILGFELYFSHPEWPIIPFAQITGTRFKTYYKTQYVHTPTFGFDILLGLPNRPRFVMSAGVGAPSVSPVIYVAQLSYIFGR